MTESRLLVIATHNPAKINEIKTGLSPLKRDNIKFVTLKDLKITDNPAETGNTFFENSLLKAHYYADLSKLPAIADDGGLIIPYLNNEPGVLSRRWMGYDASDDELIEYTLKKLRDTRLTERKAYLETCICFYDPLSKKSICEQEKISGFIAGHPYGKPSKGFPYRALFVVDKFNKYYDALTAKEHEQINHRLIALKRLVKKIPKHLLE